MIDKEDLTTGSVSKKLIVLALPLLLADLLQSFYSIVDILMVGRTVGETGLAAISNVSMVSFIINSICIGITIGGTVLIAQFKGANDVKGQSETIDTLFSLTLITSGVVTATALLGYKPLFGLLSIPSDAMGDAHEYMEVICWRTVFVFGRNGVCSIMKGLRGSRSPLYFVGIAAIMNIVLDLLSASPFGMGVKGAAYVTIFSQNISFTATMIHLERRSFIFDFKPGHFVIKEDKLAMTLKVGLPTVVQMVIVNISYLLITGMLNQFGIAVAATSGVGLKINTFAGMPYWAMGQIVTAMAGQSMGANNRERMRETTNTGLCLDLVITTVTVSFIQIFTGPVIRLFNPMSPEVTRDGILYLRICCRFNSLVYGAMYTFDSFAIGVGFANVAMVSALLDAVVVRPSMNWLPVFPLLFGFPGVYLGQALSPTLPAAAGGLYFKGRIWGRGNLIRR